MSKQIRDFDALTSNAAHYLQSVRGFTAWTIRHHTTNWNQLRKFMTSNGFEHYTLQAERKILYQKFKDRGIGDLTHTEKEFYNSMKRLSEFQATGTMSIQPRIIRREFVFTGKIGAAINDFINQKVADRLSLNTLRTYKRNLFRFFSHCQNKGLRCMAEIDLAFILQYISEQDRVKNIPMGMIISTLRCFMQYAYSQNLISQDFSIKIPKHRSVNQPKLPSIYSKKEVKRLITSVERSSAIGKRNYAIVLIAAKLGLRASDISRLKFDDLNWKASTIRITQYKTGKELTLPLLPDVGNAIIDYLKYGRPTSDEPYMFLLERPPYGHFTSSQVITHVIQRAFKKSGIDTTGRKFGPHSLRHSLGFRMLQDSTILPVISEVLGHGNTESTRFYLRIDLQSMQQCVLDVPPIANSFYTQNKRSFYA